MIPSASSEGKIEKTLQKDAGTRVILTRNYPLKVLLRSCLMLLMISYNTLPFLLSLWKHVWVHYLLPGFLAQLLLALGE